MQIQVTGHHVEITSSLRSFVSAKLAKLEDYFPALRKVAVVLTVEKYRHTAEIHFRADGVQLSAKKTTKDMYASVEEALAALVQQAVKRKDRLHSQNARRKTGKVVKRGRAAAADDDDEDSASVTRPKVVRSRAKATKPMAIEDAISLLNASAQPFILFRDATSGETQVLYRREDGNYGLMGA